MYLLDTVTFSEFFRRRRHSGFVEWIGDKAATSLYLSTVTIGEVERGIEAQRRHDPAFAAALVAWLDNSVGLYGDRILPVTTDIARRWGRLSAMIGNSDADVMIAATALERGLIVVTRNIRHFLPTGVPVENPFA
jgi:predicted nucleic acid-binding protein